MRKTEHSCGAVVYYLTEDDPQFVLVYDSHFGFPKGHVEYGETEEQTAIREINEETGLHVKLDPFFREIIGYELPKKPGVYKQVTFFLASFDAKEQQPQAKNEIQEVRHVDYATAYKLLWHDELRRVLQKAYMEIKKLVHSDNRSHPDQ